MKKIVILMALVGLFIFGATSVYGSLKVCSLSKHTMTKDSTYTYVNGNIWYEADKSIGAVMYYELDYLRSYYNRPVTTKWGNAGIHYMFDYGNTSVGGLPCWQERIESLGLLKGEFCHWSDTKATRQLTTGVTALYGGTSKDDIRIKSSKAG